MNCLARLFHLKSEAGIRGVAGVPAGLANSEEMIKIQIRGRNGFDVDGKL